MLPPTVDKILRLFRSLDRDAKMQTLVQYSKKLEPLPDRFAAIDRATFTVPECQTRVDVFPEMHGDLIHYYADLNVRQSPTIAAFLAILFAAINDQPPSTTLAIPDDFVRQLMEGIGLAGREVGLNGILARIKRYAEQVTTTSERITE